jgi:hypothetical protein
MTIVDLQAALRGKSVSDILITGFVGQDVTPVRFSPVLRSVYFECGLLLLKMAAVESTGTMQLSLVESVCLETENDEGMLMAVTSLGEQRLRDPDGENQLSALRLWSASELDGNLCCAAARLDLTNGQKIFVDPTYHWGLRLGGVEQEQIWRDQWPWAAGAKEDVLSL